MTSPFAFPDWVPPWAQLVLLILGIMLALAFALMPFSVFGLKSRLEVLEARLDEIQGEIRTLAFRLPERPRSAAPVAFEEPPLPVRQQPAGPVVRPPVPPAAWAPDSEPRRPIGAPRADGAGPRPRVEPKIDRGRF